MAKSVTTTKRNHVYHGSTGSQKLSAILGEVNIDLKNAYEDFNSNASNILALASGYLDPSGFLVTSKSKLNEIELKLSKKMNIEGISESIL